MRYFLLSYAAEARQGRSFRHGRHCSPLHKKRGTAASCDACLCQKETMTVWMENRIRRPNFFRISTRSFPNLSYDSRICGEKQSFDRFFRKQATNWPQRALRRRRIAAFSPAHRVKILTIRPGSCIISTVENRPLWRNWQTPGT